MDNVITRRFLKDYIGNFKEELLTLIDETMINIIRDSVDNDYHVRNEIINLINQNKINDIEFKELLIRHIGKVDIDYDNDFALDIDYKYIFDGATANFKEEDYGIKKYIAYYEKADKFIYIDLLNGGFSSLYKDCCCHIHITKDDIIKIIESYVDYDKINNMIQYEISKLSIPEIPDDYDGGGA